MSQAIEIAEKYFALSNNGKLDDIAGMFTDSSTYSSVNTGVFLGKEQIMKMMQAFHESFSKLRWEVHSTKKIRPNVFLFDFTMTGTKINNEKVEVEGLEYIIVYNGKLQHVEVRNK